MQFLINIEFKDTYTIWNLRPLEFDLKKKQQQHKIDISHTTIHSGACSEMLDITVSYQKKVNDKAK